MGDAYRPRPDGIAQHAITGRPANRRATTGSTGPRDTMGGAWALTSVTVVCACHLHRPPSFTTGHPCGRQATAASQESECRSAHTGASNPDVDGHRRSWRFPTPKSASVRPAMGPRHLVAADCGAAADERCFGCRQHRCHGDCLRRLEVCAAGRTGSSGRDTRSRGITQIAPTSTVVSASRTRRWLWRHGDVCFDLDIPLDATVVDVKQALKRVLLQPIPP